MSEDAIGGVAHNALDIFHATYEKIRFCKLKDVIFVLGNTNSAKVALTKFTAGHANSLFGNNGVKDLHKTIDEEEIFPQFELDFATDKVFYYLSAVNDVRSVPYDLPGTFFTQQLIDFVDSAKLIFLVNYESVTNKTNYNDFMKLAKNTIRTIRNIDNYKHSLALVVADVPKMYKSVTERKVLISDENIIENIADFLKGVSEHVQSKLSIPNCYTESKLYNNIAKFVNILLSNDGKTYTKIGIFRKTNKYDIFSSDILLQTCERCVENIIRNELQSSKIDKRYFSLYISSNSRKYVSELIKKVNEAITSDFAKIFQEIKDHYYSQEKRIYDIEKLYKKFDIGYASFSKISTTNFIEIGKLMQELIKNINELNINNISESHIINIIQYDKYLKFAQRFNHQLLDSMPLKWEAKLTDLIEYLNYSKEWYRFLIALHSALSKSEVQLNIGRFAGYENELNQLYFNKNEIALPPMSKLHEFLNLINLKMVDYNFAGLEINEPKVKFLQKIIKLTFGNNVSSQCADDILLITGEYVKLSDVAENNVCGAKIIKIFALNGVFVDADLDKTGDQVQIFIIAPTLHVVENRKIVLDGTDGSPHDPAKAKLGISPGGDGSNGLPGNPGSHAGNFLGIFENIVNGANLTVSAKGGRGGSGQDGGDGADGKETNTIVPTRLIHIKDYPDLNCPDPKVIETFSGINYRCRFESACSHAGKGGNGGKGGKGGNGGFIKLFELNTTSLIVMDNAAGETGQDGRGGKGGEGKREELILDNSVEVRGYISNSYRFKVVSQENVKCSEATNGTIGGNLSGMKFPESTMKDVHLATVVNDYKNYLLENLSVSNIRESALKNFVSNFENRQPIRALYDTLGYVNERQGLENRYHNLHKQHSFLPSYKSLLNRIIQHSEELDNEGKLMGQEEKVLSYLYISTLGKIHNLVKKKTNDILAISEYLDSVVKNIEEMEDLQNIVSVNDYRKSYQKQIKEDIHEALLSIQKEITPEINRQFDEVNSKIELLINNVVELQKENRKKREELQVQQGQLREVKYLRLMLGVVKAASMLLYFTGPVGMAAGSVVVGILTTTEMLAFDDTDKVVPLPALIKSNAGKVTELLKNKQLLLKEQLYDADMRMQKYLEESEDHQPSEDIQTLKTKMSDIESKIGEASPEDAKTMRQEAMDLIEKEKEILEKKSKRTDRYVEAKTKLMNDILQGMATAEVAIEHYRKYKNDEAKLKALGESIKGTDDEMKALEEVEEEMYEKLMPVCRQMENAANDLERELKDKAQVALDIRSLKMQNSLEDIKALMEKLMNGTNMNEDVATNINNLIRTINTMIQTYNRIQDYSKQAKLIDYFTDIISKKPTGPMEDNDKTLKDAIDSLKLIITSNVVLDQYNALIEVIKQDLYPFIDDYFAELNLPMSLQSDDLQSSINKAVTEMKSLQKKISTSTSISHDYSDYLYKDENFHSRSSNTLPFFVWENEKYADDINELLEGKEITMKSDITTSKLKKNAVKFNRIGINFKIANKDIQKRLNSELQDFSVTMVHPGYSYYRCENYVHVMKNREKNISYSLEMKSNGEPLHRNDDYNDLKIHDPRLSPYTVWNIKLYNDNNNFTLLKKYKNFPIDLELVGDGQYVERGINVCTEKLNKYFTPEDDILPADDTIGVFNNDRTILNEEEYHYRKCRSLDRYYLSRGVEKNFLAANGAGSTAKHSFISGVLHLMSAAFLMIDYFNPISKISQWFTRNEDSVDEDFVMLNENKVIDVKLLNIQSLDANPEILRLAKVPLEDESHAGYISDALNYSMLYNNSNLMLLDLIIRRKNGVKYKNTKFVLGKNEYSEYARTLAYREYAPTHI